MICDLREGNKGVYGSQWPDGGEPDQLCSAAPSHSSILQAKSQVGKVWAEQRLGLQRLLTWFQQKDFEVLAPGTNDLDASSYRVCLFQFYEAFLYIPPLPCPYHGQDGGQWGM